MLIHWIWLATREGIHDREKKLALDVFSDAEDIYRANEKELLRMEGITSQQMAAFLDKDLKQAQNILNKCVDKQIQVCTFHDEEYPQRLKHIVDPPMVLYYKGRLPDMNGVPVIAAIGTRKATAYGMQLAQRMGYQIVGCGAVLVSGLAKGNDAMAMQGALLAGGAVVGVLGSGVDVVYPKVNKRLFEDVLRNGCLLSEFAPGTPPYRWNFPRRNRIMSGMSNGVVVIEAPEGSGTLITARQAGEQGRDVFSVPGNVDMESFAGSLELLRDGAIAARNGWDVVGEYKALYPDRVHPMTLQPEMSRELPKVAEKTVLPALNKHSDRKKEKMPIDNPEKPPYSDLQKVLPSLPEHQRQIVELLTQERLVDELIEETGLPAAKVAAALTLLEIKGIIRRLPGKRVILK